MRAKIKSWPHSMAEPQPSDVKTRYCWSCRCHHPEADFAVVPNKERGGHLECCRRREARRQSVEVRERFGQEAARINANQREWASKQLPSHKR